SGAPAKLLSPGMGRMRPSSSWLVLPCYLAVTVVTTWPLVRDAARAIPAAGYPIDALFQAFVIGWDWRALTPPPARLFELPIDHPAHHALAFMDNLLGPTIVTAPVRILTGSLATSYDAAVVIAFVASAWGVYRLLRHLGSPRDGAWLGGLLFALC